VDFEQLTHSMVVQDMSDKHSAAEETSPDVNSHLHVVSVVLPTKSMLSDALRNNTVNTSGDGSEAPECP
jgi:hypothetical protein